MEINQKGKKRSNHPEIIRLRSQTILVAK